MEEKKGKVYFQEVCMRYRSIVILVVCGLVALGIYGLDNINKNEFPDFVVREGVVVAVYPGATSAEVEQQVTKPLENYIFTYKEVKKEKTVSYSRDGISIIVVELNDDLNDKDAFWSKFKHGVQQFKSSLPRGVLAIQVKDDFGDTSAELVALQSKNKTYRELNDYMKILQDSLRLIPSVGKMSIVGMQKEQIAVYINSDRLSQYGVTYASVVQVLAGKGFVTTGGRIKTPDYKSPIYVDRSLNNLFEVENAIVFADPAGNVVRLKDIATVKREYPEMKEYVTVNGIKSLLLSVEIKQGKNVSEMGTAVNEKIAHVMAELPRDVKMFKITDQKQVVDDSVIDFLRELLIAIVTVVLVVMLIMPRQVALVAAATIPVTIFISLGLFYIFGMELNTVTLAALIMTLGMIVDDSIVIIDGYVDNLADGMPRWKGAVQATNHFFKSIFSATLCITITFFPFLVTMTSVMHDFLKLFPWAIFIVLFVSMIVAQTFLPILMFFCIRHPIATKVGKNGKKPWNLLDWMQGVYNHVIDWCFAHRRATMGIGVSSVVVGCLLFALLPQKLMPVAQRDQFAVEIFSPTGTTVKKTSEIADSLEHIMLRDKRVVSVTSFHGMASPRFQTTYAPQIAGENFDQFIVNTTGTDATEELVKKFTAECENYFPGAFVKVKHLSYSKEENPIEVRITGENLHEINRVADQVSAMLKKMDGPQLVRTDFREPLATTRIRMNDDNASRFGLTNFDLEAMLAMRYGDGFAVNTAWEGDYGVNTVIKSDKSGQANVTDLLDEPIPVLGGLKNVPLREIATVQNQWQYGQINHRNGLRTISVVSEVKPGHNVEALTKKIQENVATISLPPDISVSFGGQSEVDGEQLPNIVHALMISVAIIFLVLLWHFRRIGESVIMLGCLSLCVLGAALGVLLARIDLSLTCVLGFVSLMGVLVRNGIILFDYAEELRTTEGLNIRDAIYHASKRRMRPIFLTSACASTGVVPMLMGGSSLWMPMAAVIFCGTLVTMLFILTVMPVAYWRFMEGAERRQVNELALEKL